MSKQMKLLLCGMVLVLAIFTPALAQDATEEPTTGRTMTDQEIAIADAVAACPMDDQITIAASVPGLNFPFFVHMMNQLVMAGEGLNAEVIQLDGQNQATKQTADVETVVTQGVDAI